MAYKEHFEEEERPIRSTGRYGLSYTFPDWSYILHWCIAAGPLLIGLFLGLMHSLVKRKSMVN